MVINKLNLRMNNWPRKTERIKRLLAPFENRPNAFLSRPLDDQKFIIRTTFGWLDNLFTNTKSPARYRRKLESMSTFDKIALEKKIMKFIKHAIINTPFSWVACPKNEEWYLYATLRIE